MKKIISWLAVAAAAGTITACNGNNTSPNPGSCGSPSGVSQTVIVYPAPGATAVPDNFGQIVVGSTSSIPSGWGVTVVDAFGNVVNGNAFSTAPSPLPSPNASPTFSNPVYQTSTMQSGYQSVINTAGTTLSVFLNNLNSGCTPSVSLGTFTTQ